MADGPIAGALTFSTTLDNSDLEKGLEEAQGKIEELKNKLEENESNQNAISQKLEEAAEAADTTKATIEDLRSQIETLEQSMEGMDGAEWETAATKVSALRSEVNTLVDTYAQQVNEYTAIDDKLRDLETEHSQYESRLQATEEQARQMQSTLSSAYYQAGVKCREAFTSMSQAASQFGQRIINLAQSTLVFQVFSDAFRTLKQGIGDALMQNEQFSASWTALGATVQGFANGIASVVAPALVSVVNVVTSCIVTMARAIDAVFKTGLVAAINGARSAAQESWRQTDASKAAAKQAEQNAKSRQQQEERYQKAVEQQRKREEASAKRLADAQEKAAKRRTAAEQKYPDALEDSAERQSKAEKDMAERRADAEQTAAERQAKAEAKMQERMADAQESAARRQQKAEESAAKRLEKAQESAAKRQASVERSNVEKQQAAADRLAKAQETAAERRASAEQSNAERQKAADDRLAKAQAKAAERLAKAEATAAQKNADAQAAYEKKVAAAQAKEAANKAKWDEKQAKAAAKLEKAQKKANATVLGFDELNKMNADSSEEAAQATEDLAEYKSTLADIEPPKTYSVDPSDYMIDPSDYAAKLKEIKDYSVDPADYAAKLKEMEDYSVDPSDYFVDPSEYQIDPSDYVIDPNDYAIDYDKYQIDPEDFFVDPEDYTFDPMDYWVDPADYAVDALEFDWKDFPEISPTEGLKQDWDALDIGKIDSKLAELEAICAGALLAIGAILAFSGINIPLGLALMAAGALLLADVVAENWEKLPAEVQEAITNAFVITGIVLIVIGAILAFSGAAMPLGIGLMAAGFALEWAAVALNWESLSPEMQSAVTTLMGILSGAFFVLGVILILADPDPTHKALGVGLMVAGAVGMAASVALAWDSLTPEMQGALTTLLTIVGTFAIVIGVVLLFGVPGMQALGIGLILTGVALLGTAVALNWGHLQETVLPVLQGVLGVIGTFCLVIGVILLFVPGQQALGVGLILGGIGLLAAQQVALNWGDIDGMREALGRLLEVCGFFATVLGVIMLFVPGNQALAIGLILFGITAMSVGEVLLEWDSLEGDLVAAFVKLLDTIAMYAIILGVILVFVPSQRLLGIGLIIFGIGLLTVEEIALDWDSLGTTLEEKFVSIAQIIATYMIIAGILLCFAQQWPIAIGLIVGGIGILGATAAAEFDWASLDGKLNEVLGTIATTIGTFMLIIGLILCFTVVNIPLGVGLIIGGIALLKVGETAFNWDSLNTTLGEKLKAIIQTIAGAMIVIGLLLACTGVALPLGLGLIVAGAGVLAVSELAIDWDFIGNKIKDIWQGIKDFWNNNIKNIFTPQWWLDKFQCIPEAIGQAINAAIEAWNSFIGGISEAIGNFVGATGGSYSNSGTVSNVRPPGLARGAVIPPNRQFMAILGDQTSGNNIETPEGLMRQVVREEAGSMMAEMMMQMQAMGGGQETGGDTNLTLYIDSEELARATAKGTSSLTRRGVLSPSATFV